MKHRDIEAHLKVIFIFISIVISSILVSCDKKTASLIIYSGKGLKSPMEEIKTAFEKRYDVRLKIVYGGTTLLKEVIEETRKGDLIIPSYVLNGTDWVDDQIYITGDKVVLAVRKDNQKDIQSLQDLARPDVRIVIGDGYKCASGKKFDELIKDSPIKTAILKNVFIKAPSCSEQLDLLLEKKVDAAIVLKTLLLLPKYDSIKSVESLSSIEFGIGVLNITMDREASRLFVDFVASEGKEIFKKYGFEEG